MNKFSRIILGLVFALAASSAWATITRVETVCETAQSPVQVTFGTATTTGELITVGVGVGSNGAADGGITDNASGGSSTYHQISYLAYGSNYADFYYAYNVASGITVVTLAVGTGNLYYQSGFCATHYTGLATSTPLDVTVAFGSEQGSPFSRASGTLSQANEVVTGVVVDVGNNCASSFTSTGALTQRGQFNNACSGANGAYADDVVSSTSSVTYSGQIPTAAKTASPSPHLRLGATATQGTQANRTPPRTRLAVWRGLLARIARATQPPTPLRAK